MATTFPQPKSAPQAAAPRTKLQYPVTYFNGIDNSNDPASIDANQSPDSLNTILDSIGAIEPRMGYTKLLTTKLSAPSNNGIAFYKSDGTKYLVYRQGQYLYKYDNAGGSTQVGGPFVSSVQDDLDVYQDVLYGVDGTDSYQYNGTTSASLLTPSGVFTSPQYLRVHKNRIWIAQGSTIYFSDAGQPTSYPVGNFININSNDSQVITGVEVLLDALVVFKTDSIWVITGEPLGAGNSTTIGNLNLRQANSSVGCVAYKTIKKVDTVLFFMARSGLYVFQNYASTLISQDVNSTFKSGMNPSAQNLSWAVYSPVQKKYLLGYASTSSNTPDSIICYDILVKRYTLWNHTPGNWATNFRFTGIDSVLVGDPNIGTIYNYFQGYADIAGYNGTITASTSTTIQDTSASWTTNQFVDCRVQAGLGSGIVYAGTITANTANTLTISGMSGTPPVNVAYTIGGYASYWKSRIFDFGAPEMSKRYKYLNMFVDSESNYSLQVGAALDFATLSLNLPPLSLSINSAAWDQVGITWDEIGIYYDTVSSLFKRASLPGNGRFIQIMFGNFNANQPWRCFDYSITYKLRRANPT